jgi:hypothetical protein
MALTTCVWIFLFILVSHGNASECGLGTGCTCMSNQALVSCAQGSRPDLLPLMVIMTTETLIVNDMIVADTDTLHIDTWLSLNQIIFNNPADETCIWIDHVMAKYGEHITFDIDHCTTILTTQAQTTELMTTKSVAFDSTTDANEIPTTHTDVNTFVEVSALDPAVEEIVTLENVVNDTHTDAETTELMQITTTFPSVDDLDTADPSMALVLYISIPLTIMSFIYLTVFIAHHLMSKSSSANARPHVVYTSHLPLSESLSESFDEEVNNNNRDESSHHIGK